MLVFTVVGAALLGLVLGWFLPSLLRLVLPGQELGRFVDATAPWPRPVLAGAGGVILALLGWRLGPAADLPAYLYLGGAGLALAAIDLDTWRLPDRLTLPSYGVGGVLLGAAALARGDGGSYLRALLGMAALYAFFFAVAFIRPPWMGFGDVKLSGVLGLYLGWLGWGVLVAGMFVGFALAALVSLALLVARRVSRKSDIPFGPFMMVGALVGVVWGDLLVDAYLGTG